MLDWIPRCFIQSIHLRQPSWGVLIGLCGTLFVRITPPSVRAGYPNSVSIVLSFCQNNSIQWKSGPSRFYFNRAFFFFRNSPPSEIEFGALLPRPIIIPGKMLCFLIVVCKLNIIFGKLLLYICKVDYNKGYLLCTPPSDIELGALFPRPIIIPE